MEIKDEPGPATAPEYEIAMALLRMKGHEVGQFSTTKGTCTVDRIAWTEKNLLSRARQYGPEWFEFLKRARGRECRTVR